VLHHVELWVPDLDGAIGPWGWLLGELGWSPFQDWPGGRSWRFGDVYLVLEQSPALTSDVHDRRAPGLNHIAFTVGAKPEASDQIGPGDQAGGGDSAEAGRRAEVDRLTAAAPGHGWALLFPDRHPHAGGPQSYAAYLEDSWGYEVEIQSGPPD
jgi:catechol 2,3-dioxygenase-like lactoylglutathione lyase family enzyme